MENIKCHAGVKATLDIIGGKWKPIILWHLAEGKLRFSELQKTVPGISQKILTQQLRELEADNIIHREVYKQIPPKVEYWTTDYGKTLHPLLEKIGNWGCLHLHMVDNKEIIK
jgi:DNA-binding HxlR family transcriptional regulator